MFGWPVLLAWLIALVLAIGIAAFAGYEASWRLGRLRTQMARLNGAIVELNEVAAAAEATRQRAERIAAEQSAPRDRRGAPSADDQ